MRKDIKGIVSIFLALILLPIYSIALVTVDVVKIANANTHLYISNETAMHSLMSKYDRDLYNKYNIFGIALEEEYINDYIRYTLEENLNNNESKFYKTKLNSSKLVLDENSKLLDSTNLEKQIVDYMKLKGPYDMSKGVINLMELIFDSKKYNGVIDKKFDYEESYSKLNVDINSLEEKIYQYDQEFKDINDEFFKINSRLKEYKKEIKELNDQIKKFEESKDDEEINENEEKIRKNIIKESKKTINELLKEYREEIDELWTKITIANLNFKEIIGILEKLLVDSERTQEKLDTWKASIDNLEDSDIKDNFKSEARSTRQEFTTENISNFLKKLKEHEDTMDKMLDSLKKENPLFKPESKDLEDFLSLEFDIKNNKKLPSLNNFKIYKYLLGTRNKKEASKEAVKESKKNKKEIENFTKNISNIEKVENPNSIYSYIDKEDIEAIANYSSISVDDISSSNKISNFRKIIKQTDNLIPNNHNNIIDNVLIAQYIVDKFGNKLDKGEDFNSQIEYILFGNQKLNRNISSVQNLIFGMRFTLNSIYAFTNAELGTEATKIATTIAGWTGFGVPLVRSGVLASMSFGESLLDLHNLNKDNPVEAYKNKATWQVSVKGLPNLLAKEVKDISNDALDNMYESISDFSSDNIDKLNRHVNEFTTQSLDGFIQSILSKVVTPVQTYLSNKINEPKEELNKELLEIINDIEKSESEENIFVKELKNKSLNILKEKIVNNIDLIDEINFESHFKNVIKDIENLIYKETSSISSELKNKINSSLNKNKMKQKEMINSYLDKYLEELGHINHKSMKSKSTFSGLNFKYKDYLLVITILRLSISNRQDIIRRMALIMQDEIRKTNPLFDIINVYTRFEINSDIVVNTFILKKHIFIENIEQNIIGGY